MSGTKTKKKKHLGLQLEADVGAMLEQMVQKAQEEAGPAARVSASLFVVVLIVEEAKRRKVVKR